MKKLLFLIILSINLKAQDTAATKSKPLIYTLTEQMPEFPGGTAALGQYFKKNIRYPKRARRQGISGKCFLKFIVNEDGSVSDVQILRGVKDCPDCDKEALRVVSNMPNWQPAKQQGRAVKCYYTQPIHFKLND